MIEVESFGSDFDVFWERVKDKYPAMIVRSSRYMNWRFTGVPGRDYRVFAAKEDGEHIRGFAVCRTADLFGLKCGIIADFLVEQTKVGEAAGRLLVQESFDHFDNEAMHLIGCLLVSSTHEFRMLKSAGFTVCPRRLLPQPFPVVMKSHGDALPGDVIGDIRNWYFTFGDYDGL